MNDPEIREGPAPATTDGWLDRWLWRPLRGTREVLVETWNEFNGDDGMLLASAIAFHALLSVAPLLVFAVAVAGAVFGREAATGQLQAQLSTWVSSDVASVLVRFVRRANDTSAGGIATVVSLGVLMFASSRLFLVLQGALNLVFGVRAKVGGSVPSVARRILLRRAIAFGMVLAASAFLLLSLLVKIALGAVGALLDDPPAWAFAVPPLEILFSATGLTVGMAAILRVLPDVDIGWGDAFRGAAVTALFVSVGGEIAGAWLGAAGAASFYGAAGSIVVFLLWAYYAAQIFLFGAQLTVVLAKRRGAVLAPLPHAVAIGEHGAIVG